jgi:F-type H+-transporting ATPase subunit a
MLKRNKFTKAGVLLLTVATILSISLVSRWTKASETHTATHDTITTVATDAHEAEHATAEHAEGEKKFNPGDMIFEHILDAHDWHLWGEGHSAVSIPLPVIVYSSQRGLDCFMSSHFHHGHKTYNGYMLHKGPNEKKASIVAVNEMEETDAHAATINVEATAGLWDISITKNVVSLIISCLLLLWIMLSVAKLYVQRKDMAPKGIQSLLEPVIIMIREDVAKASIGPKYEKFMPYLLTVFFFIFLNNLMGLVPFFPGGANLSGNISITCTLALITFVIQLVNSKGAFWQHIFAMPGVPKGVLVLLTPIEILGLFLRPFVLMVRLFANITAGHIVALAFISLIFIFNEMFGAAGGFGISIMSGAFYIFMGFLELLVAFLQAYVFTLLSAIYFGAAIEEHHH